MSNLDSALRKECGLYSRERVGKVMGNNIWFHIDYAAQHGINIDHYKNCREIDFKPTIVRLDTKDGSVSLIECDGFDIEHEPALGKVVTFKPDGTVTVTNATDNPFIYHHKWQFVLPCYQGFDYEESKMRSYVWKSILGTDRATSSRIGRANYWKSFLQEKGLSDVSELWLHNCQQYTSKQTSINSRLAPKVFALGDGLNLFKSGDVNLDIGGGRFDSGSDYMASIGIENLIFDPYNRESIDNLNVLIKVKKHPVDTVTISNVLNVIREEEVKLRLIKQAFDALKPNGTLIVTVYEGNKSGDGAVSKRDCWQENRKLADYIPLIESVFGSVATKKGAIISIKKI